MTIKRENYEKFIQLAVALEDYNVSDDEELFTFNLEGLARMVDIAFTEGRITELMTDEDYSSSPEKIEHLSELQDLLTLACPQDFVETIEDYPDGEVETINTENSKIELIEK